MDDAPDPDLHALFNIFPFLYAMAAMPISILKIPLGLLRLYCGVLGYIDSWHASDTSESP